MKVREFFNWTIKPSNNIQTSFNSHWNQWIVQKHSSSNSWRILSPKYLITGDARCLVLLHVWRKKTSIHLSIFRSKYVLIRFNSDCWLDGENPMHLCVFQFCSLNELGTQIVGLIVIFVQYNALWPPVSSFFSSPSDNDHATIWVKLSKCVAVAT